MATRVQLMGAVRAWRDGRAIDLGGPKPQLLLAILALDPQAPISTDRLIDLLWDEDPPVSARRTLQSYIASLRAAFGREGPIESVSSGYCLDVPRDHIDLLTHEDQVSSALDAVNTDPAVAAATLAAALDDWAAPLGGLRPSRRIEALLAPHIELHLQAIEGLAAARIASGDAATAVRSLEALVREHPTRETLWLRLGFGLRSLGRRDDALDAVQRARHALREHLGLEPSRPLRELEVQLLSNEAEPARTPQTGADATMSVTDPERLGGVVASFPVAFGPIFGRDELIARTVEDLRTGRRIVTLTGPAGVGKTRAGIEVSRHLAESMPVTFVGLSPLRTFHEALATLTVSVGRRLDPALDPVDDLVDALGTEPRLLLLDNCEHLVQEIVPLVEAMISRTERCLVLITSREALEIPGEQIRPLETLGTASDGDAVNLFLELLSRMGRTDRSPDRSKLAELCARLDGLPLALELAAARCGSLEPEEILTGLADRFTLLTRRHRSDSRHHSLEAALGWSWDLLDHDEKATMMRLGAFASSWTVSSMAAVVGLDEIRAVDLLDRLAAKSLVRRSHSGAGRWSMLESIRAFACDRALDHGIAEQAAQAHLAWIDSLTAQLVENLKCVGESDAAFSELEDEIDEIRTALNVAASSDTSAGLAIATRLWEWWRARLAYTAEGAQRIGKLLGGQPVPPATRVGALVTLVDLLRLLPGCTDDANEALTEARATLAAVRPRELQLDLEARILLAEFDLDDDSMPIRLSELVAAAEDAGTTADAMGLHLLSAWMLGRSSHEGLEEVTARTIRAAERSGNTASIAHARELAGLAATSVDHLDEARQHLAAALAGFEASGQVGCLLHACESIAWWAWRRGDRSTSRDLLANCLGLRRTLGRNRTISEVSFDRMVADIGDLPDPNLDAELAETTQRSHNLLAG